MIDKRRIDDRLNNYELKITNYEEIASFLAMTNYELKITT
jgi:hypothetical protein